MTPLNSEPPPTPEGLRAITFPTSRGPGYDPRDVDVFVDEAIAALEAPLDGGNAFRDRLGAVQFRMTRRRGYETQAVDDLLDQLGAAFDGRPDGAGVTAPGSAPPTPPSEFTGDQAAEAERLAQLSLQPRGSRFRLAGLFSAGWEISAVDDLVERVGFSITDPDNQLHADEIGMSTFPASTSGYRKKDVQAWLATLTRHLRSRLR